MTEMESDTDDRSLMGTLRWLLFNQFEDTTEDTLRQGFVFIGLATSFLALVGATSAFVASPQLYWVTLALGVLGVATLVFTWMILQNQLDGLFVSGPESDIHSDTAETSESVADSDESVAGESDIDA
jgi:hypothetical protein